MGNIFKKEKRTGLQQRLLPLLFFPHFFFLVFVQTGHSFSIPTGERGIFTLPTAETVGENQVSLGLWSSYQVTGNKSYLTPSPFSVELGLGRRLECGIGLQKLSGADPLDQNENIGLRVNGKYRFLNEHPRIPALALLASIDHITSNPDYGIQTILTKTFLSLQASLNFGYSQGKDPLNSKTESIIGGVGIILPIMKNLDLLGEVKTIFPNSSSQLTSLVPGARYFFNPTVNIALGLEVGVGPDDPLWNLTAGLSFAGSSACTEALEASQISPRYRKEALTEKTPVSAEEPEPEFTTPTPTFRLRIPSIQAPHGENPDELPEAQDEPTQ